MTSALHAKPAVAVGIILDINLIKEYCSGMIDITRTIDVIDLQILNILQDKARIPNVEVSRQIGMAPSAVLERIRKLEERGIIEGYEVRLNPSAFAQGLTAFLFIEADPADNGQIGERLAQVAGVQEVHQVAGPDGYLVKLRATDPLDLGRILREEIQSLPGVRATRTQIVLNTIKETRRIDLDAKKE
jgi:Lrp/AsnC family leucine-responsive transcriptional regulator